MRKPTFINPITLPEPKQLNAAEQKFVRCMKEGGKCEIGTERPTKEIHKGDNANVIRADVIRFFVWGGSKDDPIAGNTIFLSGAHISGALDLTLVSSPYALSLMHCHFRTPVKMLHAAFRLLNLSGSYLPHGLKGDGMRIDSDMFMRGGFSAEGEVRLLGANVGGDVDCADSEFKNAEGNAFIADRIKVGGDFSMKNNFSAEGAVRLLGADVGGDVYCNGGKFINPKGIAFIADGIKVGGDFSMKNNFSAEGEVRLLGANIDGDMYCRGGKFKVEKGIAFFADMIKIGGNLSLSGFSAEGAVSFAAADISGGLFCGGGEFKNGFDLEAARVGKYLRWRKVRGGGTVDLSFADVGVLEDDGESREKFTFILDGFSYQKLKPPGKVGSRIEWLDNRPKDADFSPQPFEQAAKVLFAIGHNNDARAVLWAKERRLTKHGKLPGGHKPVRQIWDWLSGYGYRLRRTLGAAALVIGLGWAVFFAANCYGYIVPHQPIVMTKVEKAIKKGHECAEEYRLTDTTVCLLPQYPRFHSLAYSADVFIPFFALHQEPYWYPQPRDEGIYWVRFVLTAWLWFEIIAGWILTSLFVLTITGLLKPRQSSLE